MSGTIAHEERFQSSEADTSTARGAGRGRLLWRIIEGPDLAAESAPLIARVMPLLTTLVPSVAMLLWLPAEVGGATPVNDMGAHRLWVQWALDRMRAGKTPLDGWIPNLSFGVPHFHYYQSRPHVIAAALEYLTGTNVVGWSVYLLLAAFPLSVYMAFCRLGWGRWAAATGGVFAVFMSSQDGHGLEIQSYVWRGRGVWTQLWASMFLPWALILGWRSVKDGKRYLVAVVAISVTMWFHLIQAWFLFLIFPLWLVISPSKFRERLPRVTFLGAASVAASLWTLLPTLGDQAYVGQTEFNEGTFFKSSYGFGTVMKWLVSGDILDHDRARVITLFALLGAVIAVWFSSRWLRIEVQQLGHRIDSTIPAPRTKGIDQDPSEFDRDETYRMALCVTGLGLALFFGPAFWGRLIEAIPGGDALIFHRFVLAVQIGFLMLAAACGGAIHSMAMYLIARGEQRRILARTDVLAAGLMVVLILAASPALVETQRYLKENSEWIHLQQKADDISDPNSDGAAATKLLELAKQTGPGRVYAGLMNTWGSKNLVYQSPMYQWVLRSGVDVIGFNIRTQSLTTDAEPRFNDTDPAQFNLFNVRYWLSDPRAGKPSEGLNAKELGRSGRFILWEVATSGWLDAIDLDGSEITTTRLNLGRDSASFLASHNVASKQFPQVDLEQDVNPLPATTGGEQLTATWDSQTSSSIDGVYEGVVNLNRDSYVLLKESYHPWWRATVDNVETSPVMVAPGFIAVPVSKGKHAVSFTYVPYRWYLPLMGIAVLSFAYVANFAGIRRRCTRAMNRALASKLGIGRGAP